MKNYLVLFLIFLNASCSTDSDRISKYATNVTSIKPESVLEGKSISHTYTYTEDNVALLLSDYTHVKDNTSSVLGVQPSKSLSDVPIMEKDYPEVMAGYSNTTEWNTAKSDVVLVMFRSGIYSSYLKLNITTK